MLKDAAGVELPPPKRKTIDVEGRIVKDGVRKVVTDRQLALKELVKAIGGAIRPMRDRLTKGATRYGTV